MDTKITKISESTDRKIQTYKSGECLLVTNIVTNKSGLPYIHDLKTNTVKTLAQKVWEEKNKGKSVIVRPTCGNMNCINPIHLAEV